MKNKRRTLKVCITVIAWWIWNGMCPMLTDFPKKVQFRSGIIMRENGVFLVLA